MLSGPPVWNEASSGEQDNQTYPKLLRSTPVDRSA